MRDICPSRDDAQPHIVENGRCVLCLKPVSTETETDDNRADWSFLPHGTKLTLVSIRRNRYSR